MKDLFERDWEITPAGGATGEAFFATNSQQQLFLKRNSSPFLAVLSAEGIVPKLVWTKRLENGDVITAQQRLNGRVCKQAEMSERRVARLLKKIHESTPLVKMLERLGKSPENPHLMLKELESTLTDSMLKIEIVKVALDYLRAHVDYLTFNQWTVCHGDVNHNNWLISDEEELYLIDWDGAMIADPAFDIGPLLYWYAPKNEWAAWLEQYGLELTADLELRMKWYVIVHTIQSIRWHEEKERFEEMDHWLNFLKQMKYC